MNNVTTIANVSQSLLKLGIYRSTIVDKEMKMPKLTRKNSTSYCKPRVLADGF
jgi:hypothetical protein